MRDIALNPASPPVVLQPPGAAPQQAAPAVRDAGAAGVLGDHTVAAGDIHNHVQAFEQASRGRNFFKDAIASFKTAGKRAGVALGGIVLAPYVALTRSRGVPDRLSSQGQAPFRLFKPRLESAPPQGSVTGARLLARLGHQTAGQGWVVDKALSDQAYARSALTARLFIPPSPTGNVSATRFERHPSITLGKTEVNALLCNLDPGLNTLANYAGPAIDMDQLRQQLAALFASNSPAPAGFDLADLRPRLQALREQLVPLAAIKPELGTVDKMMLRALHTRLNRFFDQTPALAGLRQWLTALSVPNPGLNDLHTQLNALRPQLNALLDDVGSLNQLRDDLDQIAARMPGLTLNQLRQDLISRIVEDHGELHLFFLDKRDDHAHGRGDYDFNALRDRLSPAA